MDKLNELKEQFKVLIEGTEDTELIKSLASIQDTINGVEEEQNTLLNKHAELSKAYKEAILHGGYTNKPVEDATGTKVVDFDTMLNDFIKEIK